MKDKYVAHKEVATLLLLKLELLQQRMDIILQTLGGKPWQSIKWPCNFGIHIFTLTSLLCLHFRSIVR